MTLDQTFEISPDVVSRDVDGELVLLNLKSGLYFGLDPIGNQIWSQLEAGKPLSAAHAVLLDSYDVTPEQLKEDILQLTNQLVEQDLITATPA